MKLLLFLHELAVGGTSVNAIELATRLASDHGHEVALFAPPGPMGDWVSRSGLRWFPAPPVRMHPSMTRIAALREVVRSYRPDLVHVWETWALMDALLGVHLSDRTPLLVTDMQMHVARVLPRRLPFTFGTPALVERARGDGIANVGLLLPPVDTAFNAPGTHDPKALRAELGVPGHALLYVIVSRLAHAMKGESIRHAIRAVDAMATERDARLVVIGDGPAHGELAALADRVNQLHGRRMVLLPGASLDPRPAYAAADVVIGMGSSALRGMAYAKPVIVVGEQGFARALTPDSAASFLHGGLYGVGEGTADEGRLLAEMRHLAASEQVRSALGRHALDFVRRHFSLDAVCESLSETAQAAIGMQPRPWTLTVDVMRTLAIYLRERRFLWRAAAAPVPGHAAAGARSMRSHESAVANGGAIKEPIQ